MGQVLLKSEKGGASLRVLGTTLWSAVSEDQIQAVQRSLNDYHTITIPLNPPENGRRWRKLTVADTMALHQTQLAWLKERLAADPDIPTLIVTHHAPIRGASHPQHKHSPIGSGFETDLTDVIQGAGPGLRAWFFGHTHYSTDQIVGSVRVVSNQFGYPFESKKHWRPDLVVPL